MIHIANPSKSPSDVRSVYPANNTLIEAYPPVIRFINQMRQKVQTKILRFHNKDKVTRKLKIVPPNSSYYRVIPRPDCEYKYDEDGNFMV